MRKEQSNVRTAERKGGREGKQGVEMGYRRKEVGSLNQVPSWQTETRKGEEEH